MWSVVEMAVAISSDKVGIKKWKELLSRRKQCSIHTVKPMLIIGKFDVHGAVSASALYTLFQDSLQALQNLQLNLSLSNVLLAATAAGNLLGLSDLRLDGLGAEVLDGVSLNSVDAHGRVGLNDGESTGKEELLAAATVLDDLNQTGLQLLDGGNVVGENTHLSGLGGDVDLDDILGLVDGLVGESQAQLDLVRGSIGIGSSLQRDAESCGTSSQSSAGDAEGVHDGWCCQLVVMRINRGH